MPVSYRETLEELLYHELQTIQMHTAQLDDISSDGVVEWWAQNGSKLPLLNVFARVAIITPIVTLEVERQFGCQGEFIIF